MEHPQNDPGQPHIGLCQEQSQDHSICWGLSQILECHCLDVLKKLRFLRTGITGTVCYGMICLVILLLRSWAKFLRFQSPCLTPRSRWSMGHLGGWLGQWFGSWNIDVLVWQKRTAQSCRLFRKKKPVICLLHLLVASYLMWWRNQSTRQEVVGTLDHISEWTKIPSFSWRHDARLWRRVRCEWFAAGRFAGYGARRFSRQQVPLVLAAGSL